MLASRQLFDIFRIVLTLVLGARDLANVRFAFSPLWECVAAFRAWRDPARHALHLPWIAAADRAARGADWTALDAALHGTDGFFPDFLSPTPTTPLARFMDEVAAVRRTPAAIVRRELAAAHPRGLPRALASAERTPRVLVGHLADQLTLFWQRCLRPVWPRVRARLDAEILVRSRALALGGADALFDGLHRQVRWRARGAGGRLTFRAGERYTRHARGVGLVLIPSVFSWPDVYATAHPPWRPNFAYPVRGLDELWAVRAPALRGRSALHDDADALAQLVGSGRAHVLRALNVPRTTLELSDALRRSAPAVSEQLTALDRAGVVTRTRVGRSVYYELNARGRRLLQAVTTDAT